MKKICSTCGEEKDIEEFWKHARMKDGRRSQCKACILEYKRGRYDRDYFLRVKKGSERLKKFMRTYLKKYYQDNKEKYKQKNAEWLSNPENRSKNREYKAKYKKTEKGRMAEHKYRTSPIGRETGRRNESLRRAGGTISQEQWDAILLMSNGVCLLCGEKKNLEVDHWIPVVRGGRTELGNIVPLCRTCNAKKGDREPDLFVLEVYGRDVLANVVDFLESQGESNDCG